MDLRWLDAPASVVFAEKPDAGIAPGWVPTRRRVLVRLSALVVLWGGLISLMVVSARVDLRQDGEVRGADVIAMVVTAVLLTVGAVATFRLYRWSCTPPPATRLRRARRELTAAANGFSCAPMPVHAFRSMLTGHPAGMRHYPRFLVYSADTTASAAAEGATTRSRPLPAAEFGTMRARVPRAAPWQYVRVTLAAPLPHLVLDSRANDTPRGGLPEVLSGRQRLFLQGSFDRAFRAYAPEGYVSDALYVLTPDVLVELLDHASDFDVEIVDRNVVFFRATAETYDDPRAWERVDAILTHVAPRLVTRSQRYVDERVEGQAAVQIAASSTGAANWRPDAPRVGHGGRRLRARIDQAGWPARAGVVGWFLLSTAGYGIPLFLGSIMLLSIFDGW